MYKSKYGAKKTVYCDRVYDSKKEAKRAYELDMLERAGVICGLEKQKKILIQDGFTDYYGNKEREISYIADFYYYNREIGRWTIEDTKGFKTETYKIKKKLVKYRYPDVDFIES